MSIVLDGTSGITNDSGYTGDGVSFADSTPANTLVTTSGGNVGIGTSSPAAKLDVAGSAAAASATFSNFGSATTAVVALGDGNTGLFRPAANTIGFTANGSERARIDSSGNLLVGTTSQVNAGLLSLAFNTGVNCGIATRPTNNAGYDAARFFNSSTTQIGSVSCTTTNTSYATSSDYRLKENIAPITGALAKVAALKPVTYTWKSTGEVDEGFIAHELQEVCPSAVTGEKDAVDAEGNPVYQGIDTSFLAGLYAAALQELKAINDAQAQTINAQQTALESLTARVVALETQP